MTRFKYDEWIGRFDGTHVMRVRYLLRWHDWNVDLHCFVASDEVGCFHTHPASALRIVLWGGYVEEMSDGTTREWRPGMFGIVKPELAHRVASLRNGRCSLSLWIRAPKWRPVELIGPGWKIARQKAIADGHIREAA